MLVSVIGSLVMAAMVAGAAVAIERTSDASCGMGDSQPCNSVPEEIRFVDEWCKSINGKVLCEGEPT